MSVVAAVRSQTLAQWVLANASHTDGTVVATGIEFGFAPKADAKVVGLLDKSGAFDGTMYVFDAVELRSFDASAWAADGAEVRLFYF